MNALEKLVEEYRQRAAEAEERVGNFMDQDRPNYVGGALAQATYETYKTVIAELEALLP